VGKKILECTTGIKILEGKVKVLKYFIFFSNSLTVKQYCENFMKRYHAMMRLELEQSQNV